MYVHMSLLYRHCKKGHSMTIAGCSAQKCASENELAPWRYVFMSVVGLLCGLMWLVLSWRPVFPTLDRVNFIVNCWRLVGIRDFCRQSW